MRAWIAAGLSCAVMAQAAGPVSEAGASPAGIRSAITSAEPTLLADEAATVAAIGSFAATRQEAPVANAAERSIAALRGLRKKVLAQPSSRARTAKSVIVRGLNGAIAGYQTLKKAFETASTSTTAAVAGIEKAVQQLEKGKQQLQAGIALLG